MKEWWDGRDLTNLLLKQFFYHFRNTIFIVENQKELIGFFMGYFSQVQSNEAYIHFVAVNPNKRKAGIGRFLYETFFTLCKEQGRTIVRSCTAPINIKSIEFHLHMGFRIEPGNGEINRFPVTLDYLGQNDHKVLFLKELTMKLTASAERK
ncbi:MAG: GNAT family N-acetyltransferase [Anaerolineaceae bacterium]|nr:MAG: GNAT family N-acetyltransferase [Anaerolineaceae bacterium]